MAGTLSSSTLHCKTYLVFGSQNPWRALNSSFLINIGKRSLIRCSAKKKIGFTDQILDYIEGGPKLRRWYGAPELLPKDGSVVEDQEGADYPEDEVRDAVLVTDGDSEIGQMVILSLIVKRIKVKALVKDKRSANEAFGTYVESISGDTSDQILIKKALRGVRAIICPNEGFLSSVESFKGVEHIVLLSQLSAYRASSGIQAIMTSNQRKLAEEDESALIDSRIPYSIIRAGKLQSTPGGTQGFNFEEGCAASGSLSMEDAASVCVEALEVVPEARFTFEVVNGGETVSDWKECLTRLIEKTER
ncbi:uncharacterized protein At2g37660, chloroplastic-like [Hibiscus syriacus]|uniref:uncharacterized protein At2g37660, chloroplastic-like n=1 Tax=Hibiscus syriacus TaxID=106335 RepID=UPI001921A206|nr:uncharacterized protein At2g37660, chloroplastic-like [Hibiscus syriacus]